MDVEFLDALVINVYLTSRYIYIYTATCIDCIVYDCHDISFFLHFDCVFSNGNCSRSPARHR